MVQDLVRRARFRNSRDQDLSTTQRYMHLSPAAVEGAIRLLDGPAPSGRWRRRKLTTVSDRRSLPCTATAPTPAERARAREDGGGGGSRTRVRKHVVVGLYM